MATTVVFGGGPTSTVAVDRALAGAGVVLEGTGIDVVIAADSGLVACTAAGLDADVVIGDMDSVPPELLEQAASHGARIEIRPRDKDATDLELALDLALELSRGRSGQSSDPDESGRLVVIGSGGGRLDHLVAGMALLGSARYASMELECWLGSTRVIPVRGRRRISAEVGSTVSLLVLHGRATGVTTAGLRWPLERGELEAGTSLGVSNLCMSGEIYIDVEGPNPVTVVIPGPEPTRSKEQK